MVAAVLYSSPTPCSKTFNSTLRSFIASSRTVFIDYCLDRFFWATRFLFLVFRYFFISVPCARLSWPSRQLLSARKSTVSYRIVSYVSAKSRGMYLSCTSHPRPVHHALLPRCSSSLWTAPATSPAAHRLRLVPASVRFAGRLSVHVWCITSDVSVMTRSRVGVHGSTVLTSVCANSNAYYKAPVASPGFGARTGACKSYLVFTGGNCRLSDFVQVKVHVGSVVSRGGHVPQCPIAGDADATSCNYRRHLVQRI